MDVFFPEGTSTRWGSFEVQLHSTGLGDYPAGGTIGATTGTITFTDIPKSNAQQFVPNGTLASYVSTDGYILTKKYLIQKSELVFNQTEYSSLLTRTKISQYDTLYVTAQMNDGVNENVAATLDFIETI